LRASGVVVDFMPIRRIASGLGSLVEYEFHLSRFNETSVLKQGPISIKVCQRLDDGLRIVVELLYLLKETESERLQQKFENLVNLRYQRIICLIDFVLPSQLQSQLWGLRLSICIVGVILYHGLCQFHQCGEFQ
jgi:hypothetical protein